MKLIAVALIATSMLITAAGVGFAKDLSTVGLEEAFVDSVGTCGPQARWRACSARATILR